MIHRLEVPKSFSQLLKAVRCNTRGGVIVSFALILPIVAVIACGAIEIAEVVSAKSRLQASADNAALSGARQFGADRSAATSERVRQMAYDLAEPLRPRWSVVTEVASDAAKGAVTVTQKAIRDSLFGNLLPPGGFKLNVSATGVLTSGRPLCVLALEEEGKNALSLKGTSLMTADQCLVQSNSNMKADGNSAARTGTARAVGSASGNITPVPTTDAPAIGDPFAALPINVPERCDDEDIKLESGVRTLNPGVHCGEIQLKKTAKLVLNPGDHFFIKGDFNLFDDAELSGTDVVLVFKGKTELSLKGNSTLSIDGRRTGPFAGFALITDRSFKGKLDISTARARRFQGTIYVPSGTFAATGAGNRVGDQSPWTILVAKNIEVTGSAHLFINSNYASSQVPAPSGVGPNGSARLAD